jgi:nucleotide-binding universal stress UspA family protein
MRFSSVLIPHDGSTLAGTIVASLGPLLQAGTVANLLCVEDGPRSCEEALAAAEREIVVHGAAVARHEVTSDDPAGAILDVATELRPDLVAMSTHGRTGIKRWIRGSVAERVLHECPAPLLLVNPHTHSASSFDRVLVPLDASDYSAQILDTLLPFAKTFEAELTLLYVDFDDPTDTPKQAEGRRAARKDDIERSVIEELAKPDDYDLVAMSTHGNSGPSRWSLGSVTTKVLRNCQIPVLLHRTRRPSAA